MVRVKKGEMFSCGSCGLILTVEEPCLCAATEVVCCGSPMAKGKAAAEKARKILMKEATEGEKIKKASRKCVRKKTEATKGDAKKAGKK